MLLLTCPPGLEDVVELELRENDAKSIIKRYRGVKGLVLADVEFSKAIRMRSIHHIIEYIASFKVEKSKQGLDTIYNKVKQLDIRYLERDVRFRVTSERLGEHEYTSIDIQKHAGQAIVDKYHRRVDLEDYDINVIVNVIGDVCIVGVSLTKESLHKRSYRVFDHPAALKATIAYGMVRLADPKDRQRVVDPMCGSGTILIEAALYNNNLDLYGFDINDKYIEHAKANARRLSKVIDGVDRIITNPPYGIRLEPRIGLNKLYNEFARESYKVMSNNSRLVTITLRHGMMSKALELAGFEIINKIRVMHGDLWTRIIIAEKR